MFFGRKTIARSLLSLLALSSSSSAILLLESEALEVCQENSGFTASLFDVVFTPGNNSLAFNAVFISTISGNVTAEIDVIAYGYNAIQKTLDPCELNLSGLCPLASGDIQINSNIVVPSSVTSQLPGIAFQIPDLDGIVQVKIKSRDTGVQLACVQADLSNGKTVYQKGVGWATGVVAGLALLVSAIVSGLGHSNAASHIAANAMSLFGFFQAQAFFGMTAVHLPPIASSWTQNFQWSMGIIRLGFIQHIATWYQQSTGGTPSTVLSSVATTSVIVEKRDLGAMHYISRAARQALRNPMIQASNMPLVKRASALVKRGVTGMLGKRAATNDYNGTVLTIKGIERVGFRADIELSNIFMTGYIFLMIFFGAVILGLVLFKVILEALVRSGKVKSDKFQDFRTGFGTTLRGICFRLVLIGFPQMVVLGFWELTKQDSAGEMALAVVTVFTMLIMLVWACFRVWMLARRSIAAHKNPAYILYSDPDCLHKWGFLYVQFKATTYWWVMPLLAYILLKGLFVGLAQNSPITQAIAFLVLEAALLIGLSITRPYMDKKTNAFNISISAVNFVSSIFLLFFTDIFGVPGLVVGVMGVIFFILNAAFALILVLMVLVATIYAIFQKNPDVRYQPMRDDRGSFIKSQSRLNTELDALGATARGESKMGYKGREGDDESYSSSWDDARAGAGTPHNGSGYSALSDPYNREMVQSPKVGYAGNSPYVREDAMRSQASFGGPGNGSAAGLMAPSRSQTASPWQRGAGYDR